MVEILHIDIDPQFLETVRKSFKNATWNLESTNNYLNGIELIKQNKIDIVISGYNLESITAVELYSQIQKIKIETKFILLSENNDYKIVTEALNRGIDYFIHKNNPNFLQLLSNYINKSIQELNTNNQERINREKYRLQKNELSELASVMSHDIRNSLAVIKNYATFLADTDNLKYVSKIVMQVDQINSILTHSVELANKGLTAKKVESVELISLINQVGEIVIPTNIKLKFQGITTSLIIKGDKQKLFQLFKNIFENSVVHGKPSQITTQMELLDEGVLLNISNDGDKISAQKMKSLNEGTTKRQGMSIIQKIISGHQWRFQIKNQPITQYIINIPQSDVLG